MPFYTIAILATIIAGLVIGFVSTSSLIGYAIGIALGITLVLAVVKKLGKKAQTSKDASVAFYKLTKYKASVYHFHEQKIQNASAVVYGDAHEYADLMDVLKGQMKFPTPIAKEAAKYAMDTAEDKPFEEKIRVALQYLGDGHKDEATKD